MAHGSSLIMLECSAGRKMKQQEFIGILFPMQISTNIFDRLSSLPRISGTNTVLVHDAKSMEMTTMDYKYQLHVILMYLCLNGRLLMIVEH